MKFISWNVNGLRACMGKGFMDFFNAENADFFCLQETKLQPDQINLELPGYQQFWHSAQRKGYSGTAIFTKHQPLSVSYGMDDYVDDEGRLITLEFEKFYLITSYSPNSKEGLARIDYRMDFEDKLRTYMLKLAQTKPVILCGDLNNEHPSPISEKKGKPVILCGDLNVAATELDLKNPKSNRKNPGFSDEERAKFQQLLEAGFVDTFRHLHPDLVKYSWWSYRFRARENNAGWRIDYFICSEDLKDKIKFADIQTDVMGSDHCPVMLDIDI